ncbi:perlucin-like protein isoform X1 [Saccostrea cucullata]|uniref:perlucin-like protein isoform X1 n=1 Tax=Saccostrea cuccullata TaxID=36930 RepID=UPI002ED4E97C
MHLKNPIFLFCVVYGFFVAVGFAKTLCSFPWIEFNGHCYMFGTDKKSWFESKVACNTKNAYLARVETPRENDWIIQQLFALNNLWYWWIGGNTLRKVGDWKWESTNEKIGYTFFYPSEPNRPTIERCLCFFNHDKKAFYWGDATCSGKLGYICEKDN